MTSNPSSTTTPKPSPTFGEALADALTSHEYNDVTGCVTVNVVDALMAIANSINRLASVHEKAQEHAARATERMAALVADHASDRPGHA